MGRQGEAARPGPAGVGMSGMARHTAWAPRAGTIEFCGLHAATAGWFFCGWIAAEPGWGATIGRTAVRATATLQGGRITAPAIVVAFDRPGAAAQGTGIVVYLADVPPGAGPWEQIELTLGGDAVRLVVSPDLQPVLSAELAVRVRGVLSGAAGEARQTLLSILARRGYAGVDTLDALGDPVRMGFDEVILCRPDGVVIIGWCLAAPGVVTGIWLCVGTERAALDLGRVVPVERLDVLDGVGAPLGLTNRHCGFVAFLPVTAGLNDPMYLQVETRSGETGYFGLRPRGLVGLTAMRRILEVFEVQYGAVRPAYDTVIGPALRRLNAMRLETRPPVTCIRFGTPLAAPRCTIVVPLHGRIDYLESQLGLMSGFAAAARWEFIYVVDDPPRQQEAQALAESVYARFAVPFMLLLLGENLGYAPANNIGLAYARGRHVCFLNSDVFPCAQDWLDRLCARLDADETLGAVSGVLLFEDGSVQHEGMRLAAIPALGGLLFPLHIRKGRRPRSGTGLDRADMLTGACLVMRRDVVAGLGGFDEGYIVGDFEDSDLCARLQAEGKGCAIDHEVQLHHLERQSQAGPDHRWRRNLTLYNAWRFNARQGTGAALSP